MPISIFLKIYKNEPNYKKFFFFFSDIFSHVPCPHSLWFYDKTGKVVDSNLKALIKERQKVRIVLVTCGLSACLMLNFLI